jgi:ornithine cyclodeaminase/alanine dehydrogenase-like protein (mu-crystallin family)
VRVLTADEVRIALPMHAAIEAMRGGFAALSSGRATVPLRTTLPTPGGVTLLMPAHLHDADASTVKIVSVYGGNAARGLPIIHATVLVLDATTGQPRAILDGAALTAIRTGAGAGLATELLAREDAAIVGCIGAGTQSRTQIEAALSVRPIREVRVFCRTEASRAMFCRAMQQDFPKVRFIAAKSRADALDHADILIAATTSAAPVITADDVQPGVHINGIGSYLPTMQEVAAEVVARATVVVDSREAALHEAGDLIIPHESGAWQFDHIHAELGEIVAGVKPGRTSDDQITFFKSVGNAVQDAAAAARVLQIAEANDLGTVIEF